MEGAVFGCIQETARAGRVHGEELAPFRTAESYVGFLIDRPKGTVLRRKATVRLLAEARSRHRCHDQRCLVAVLGGSAAVDSFDRLNGIQGNLRGKEAALLIRNGLIVDRESHLRVISERMKKTIRVRHHCRRGKRDDVAEPGCDRRGRHLGKQRVVDVRVCRWRRLDQRRLCAYRHGRALRLDCQADLQTKGHDASDGQIMVVMLESGGIDFEVVDVRRDIRELNLARSLRRGLPPIQGQIVGQGHRRAGYDGSARIGDFPADGPRSAQRLAIHRA